MLEVAVRLVKGAQLIFGTSDFRISLCDARLCELPFRPCTRLAVLRVEPIQCLHNKAGDLGSDDGIGQRHIERDYSRFSIDLCRDPFLEISPRVIELLWSRPGERQPLEKGRR